VKNERRREIYFQTEAEAETETKGEQMKVQELKQQLDAAKKKQHDLKTQLADSTAALTKIQTDYEGAVNNDVDEAKLDAMHAEMKAAEIKVDRARKRLDQVDFEIQQLGAELRAAYAEAEWEKYVEDTKAGRAEAQQIEAKTQELIRLAAVHDERLQRLHRYAQSLGVQPGTFRRSNLEGRLTAMFKGTGQYKDQRYDEIFESNIASIERQLQNKSAPAEPTGVKISTPVPPTL